MFAGELQPDELPGDDTAVRGRARAASGTRRSRRGRSAPGRRRACTGGRRTASSGSSGRARARAAPVPVVVDLAGAGRRPVGVVSERLSKTFSIPLFSATKTRPSVEKRTFVGFVRPEKTTESEKPAGRLEGVAATVVCGFPRKGFADCAGGGGIAPDETETRRNVTAAAVDNPAIRLFTDSRMGEVRLAACRRAVNGADEKLDERVGRRLGVRIKTRPLLANGGRRRVRRRRAATTVAYREYCKKRSRVARR